MVSLRYLIVGLVFSLLGAESAQAALIKETWRSTITSVDHTAFAVGDQFDWSVTYDDSSLRMHVYNDGPNDVAEFGANDDTINRTYCAGAEAYTAGCTISYSTYPFLADAVFDLSQYYDVMMSAGLTGVDYFNENASWIYNNGIIPFRIFQGDDFLFNPSGSFAATYYFQGTVDTLYKTTYFNSEFISSTAVPESASIMLMGIGLGGLIFSSRRKANNSMA